MGGRFERLARFVTLWAGSNSAATFAFLSVLVWLAFGPFFGFSSDYQMIINTGTTIVTFLMVFLIQRSQTTEALAIQLQGVKTPSGEEIPNQFIQIIPYVLTIIVLAGFIGHSRAPRALGLPYQKER